MSALGEAIHSHLAADAAIATAVGTRIFPTMAPENTSLPLIVYTVIGREPQHHLKGAMELSHKRVQIDCYAADFDSACNIGNNVRLAWDGWQPAVMGQPPSTMNVRTVLLIDQDSSREPFPGNADVDVFRESLEFDLWHTEDVTTF